jgi:hypothetical protein
VQCNISATPERGAWVSGQGRPDGTFTIESVPAGHLRFTLVRSQSFAESYTYDVEVPEVPEFEKSFVLPSGSIAGNVLDGEGQSLSDAQIMASAGKAQVDQPTRFANPSQDGRYKVQGLKPGRYTVTAFRTDHNHAVTECVVSEGAETQLDIRFPSQPAVLVSEAYGYEDGEPRLYARLTITTTDGALITNSHFRTSTGEMRATLPPGMYDVSVSEPGFTTAQHQVTLAAGETKVLRDVLQHAGDVAVRVQRADGSAAPDVSLRLVPVGESIQQPLSGKSDRSGYWEAADVLPGRYRAEAALPSAPQASQELQVVPGQTAQAMITLP